VSKLNPKQTAFVREYLVDHNGTQAAIRAGYSKRTAGSQAYDLLKKPEIRASVEDAEKTTAEKAGLTLERLDRELARVCFSDMRQAYGKDGQLLSLPKFPEDLARAVQAVEEDEEAAPPGEGDDEDVPGSGKVLRVKRKVKVLNKTDAMRLAYQRLGALGDKDEGGQPTQVRILIGAESVKKAGDE
jgi:phage terminase small subunit